MPAAKTAIVFNEKEKIVCGTFLWCFGDYFNTKRKVGNGIKMDT